MTTATSKRPALPFSARVRMHPRAGDKFLATGSNGCSFCFGVDYVSPPWVMYQKWAPGHPERSAGCKVRLCIWRDNLSRAQIEKVNA